MPAFLIHLLNVHSDIIGSRSPNIPSALHETEWLVSTP